MPPKDEFDFDANIPSPQDPPVVAKDKKKPEEKKESAPQKKEEEIEDPLDLEGKDKQKSGTAFDLLDLEDHEEEEEEEKKEEKEEEEDEKKKEEEKNDKDASNKVLRQQRDEARKALEPFKGLDPAVAKTMTEFLAERFPDKIPSAEELKGELLLMAEKDKENEKLRQQLEEQGKSIKDLDIRMSPEFKSQFIEPYQEASKSLFVEFANVKEDGTAIAPNATATFNEWLLKNSKDIDAIKMKAALVKYSEMYKAESGEDYTPPAVSTMMSAVRDLNGKKEKMNTAYDNWDKQRSESVSKRQAEQEKAMKDNTERAKRLRKVKASEAMSDYNYNELIKSGIFKDKSEYTRLFSEEYQFTESIFDDPSKAPDYSELVVRGFKARAFDRVYEEYKKLREFKETHDAELQGESKHANDGTKTKSDEDDDWSDGKL